MSEHYPYPAYRNGRPATAADLVPVAFAGYAHFTAMQVRGGRVRGLDLHLERLREASVELFGRALPDERVRELLRAAVAGGPADMSLTAVFYLPTGEFNAAGPGVEPDVLVRTAPPSSGPDGPLSLWPVEHERMLPHIKHVGEVAKTYHLRQAVAAGFDDAVFLDRRGRISEATIWNVAFWDGEAVVWPEAAVLEGTAKRIVSRRLAGAGVPQRVRPVEPEDVAGFAGAVVMNSWTPGVAVDRIGDARLARSAEFAELLHGVYDTEPLEAP